MEEVSVYILIVITESTQSKEQSKEHHYRSSPSTSSIKQDKGAEPCLSESQASAAPRRRNRTSSDDSLPAAPAPPLQGRAPTTHRVLKTGHPFNQHRHSFRKKKWHPRRLLWILCCTVSWINDRSCVCVCFFSCWIMTDCNSDEPNGDPDMTSPRLHHDSISITHKVVEAYTRRSVYKGIRHEDTSHVEMPRGIWMDGVTLLISSVC